MTNPKTTDALLSGPEVRELIDRAMKVLEGVSLSDLYDGDEGESDSANRRLSIGMEAVRFALRNAEALGDARLLDAVLCTLNIEGDLLFDSEGPLAETFPEVLASVLSTLRIADPQVDELVVHPQREVRAAVAEGLRPRTRWARAHLETLAHDFWPSVRLPAQAALRSRRTIPTWWGRFARDPLGGRSPADVEGLQPHLDALAEIFDQHDYAIGEAASSGVLAKALSRLPSELGAELAEKTVRAGLPSYPRPVGLFGVALRGPDAAGFIDRWLGDWQDSEDYLVPLSEEFATELSELPHPVSAPLHRHLIDGLRAAPEGPYRHDGFRQRAARLLGKSWPATVDPSPVLDLILEQPEAGEEGSLSGDLAWALRRCAEPSDALLERMLGAQQAGWPGHWGQIRHSVEPHLEKVPSERLRAVAQKALHHPEDQVASWALRQLLTRLHDRQRDGSRVQAVAGYWSEPRWRRLLIAYDANLVLPLLRADLRAGALNLSEAVAAMQQIGLFYGGVGPGPRQPTEADVEREAEFHKTMQRPVRDLLGRAPLKGPPTAAEWAAFRAARARDFEALLEANDRLAAQAIQTAPPGPDWDAEDRAMFWRAVKLAWQTKNDQLTLGCLQLMAHKPLREDMLVLEKLHRIDAAGWGAGHHLRTEIRKSLGLDVEPEDDEPDEEPPGSSPSPTA